MMNLTMMIEESEGEELVEDSQDSVRTQSEDVRKRKSERKSLLDAGEDPSQPKLLRCPVNTEVSAKRSCILNS